MVLTTNQKNKIMHLFYTTLDNADKQIALKLNIKVEPVRIYIAAQLDKKFELLNIKINASHEKNRIFRIKQRKENERLSKLVQSQS